MRAASLLLTLVLGSLTGCAVDGTSGNVTGSHAGDHAALGAAAGGVAGFFLCKLARGSDVACRNLALAGAVGGGFAGWQHGKQRDVTEARALENELRRAQIAAVTRTGIVQRPDNSGNNVSLQAWAGTDIPLPPKALASRDQELRRMVVTAGQFAGSRSEPTRVLVRVPPRDRAVVLSWLNEGIASTGTQQRPIIHEAVPQAGESALIQVAPVDQTQFARA